MFLVGTASAKAIINAPIELINIGEWMFTLKSEEYAACAEGHQGAAQGHLVSGKRFSVNLEIVADMFMIQHYIEKVAERDHVVGFSPNSVFFLNDTDYVISQITWDLKVTKLDDARCELSCSVISESENEAFVTQLNAMLKDVPPEHTPLQQHIAEETPLFGKDIERKALAGVWSSQ